MSNALEPRKTEPGSQYRWLKGGLRLLGRASASWLLAWLALAIAVLMVATSYPLVALLFMGVSMMTFDLHTLAFDQAASARPRWASLFTSFGAMLSKNAGIYLKAFIVRMTVVVMLVAFSAGVLWTLREYGIMPPTPPGQYETNTALFGISWGMWSYAWFLPAVFQRGGLISMRSWLMRRHGVPEEIASGLQVMAILRNHQQMLSFQRWIMLPSLLSAFFVPILLPVLELAWAASVRCMYKDLFEGGMGIEEQSVEVATPEPQVALLPVSR